MDLLGLHEVLTVSMNLNPTTEKDGWGRVAGVAGEWGRETV